MNIKYLKLMSFAASVFTLSVSTAQAGIPFTGIGYIGDTSGSGYGGATVVSRTNGDVLQGGSMYMSGGTNGSFDPFHKTSTPNISGAIFSAPVMNSLVRSVPYYITTGGTVVELHTNTTQGHPEAIVETIPARSQWTGRTIHAVKSVSNKAYLVTRDNCNVAGYTTRSSIPSWAGCLTNAPSLIRDEGGNPIPADTIADFWSDPNFGWWMIKTDGTLLRASDPTLSGLRSSYYSPDTVWAVMNDANTGTPISAKMFVGGPLKRTNLGAFGVIGNDGKVYSFYSEEYIQHAGTLSAATSAEFAADVEGYKVAHCGGPQSNWSPQYNCGGKWMALPSLGADNVEGRTISHVKKADGQWYFAGISSNGVEACNGYADQVLFGVSRIAPTADTSTATMLFVGYEVNGSYADLISFNNSTDGTLWGCGRGGYIGVGLSGGQRVGDSGIVLTPTRMGLLRPAAIANMTATDGTIDHDVRIRFASDTDAERYNIYRGATPTTLSKVGTYTPTDLTAATLDYLDTPPDGVTYYYAVAGENTAVGEGPKSANDSGWAEYPPTATSASLVHDISKPTLWVDAAPVITDPNPQDTFTVTVLTQPVDGTVSVLPTKQLRFTPKTGLTNGMLSGINSFTYSVTDRFGASVTGTGKISQKCPAPNLDSVASAGALEWTEGAARAQFDAHPCVTDVSITFETMPLTGTTPIKTETVLPAARGDNQGVEVVLPFLDEGAYPLKATMTAKYWDGTINALGELAVANYNIAKSGAYTVQKVRDPQLLATHWAVIQDEDAVNIEARPGATNCPQDTEAVAAVDFKKCFYSWSLIPAGLAIAADSTLKLVGTATAQGTSPAEIVVKKYDPTGVVHEVARVSQNLVVNVPVPPVFEMRASHLGTVRQVMENFTASVKQTDGSPCELYLTAAEAATRALGGVRACSVTFPALDPDLTATMSLSGTADLSGRFKTTGDRILAWAVKRHLKNGTEVAATSGSHPITVAPHGMTFALKKMPSTDVMALVAPVSAELQLTGGRGCSLTSNINEAKNSVLPGASSIRCLGAFTAVPTGMTPSTRNPFKLGGTLPAPAIYPLNYTVKVVFPDSSEVLLASATDSITAIATEPPTLDIQPAKRLTAQSGQVYGYATNGLIARVKVARTLAKSVDIDVYKDNVLVTTLAGLKANQSRALLPANPSIWQQNGYKLVAKYTDFPAVSREYTFDSLAVLPPKLSIAAVAPREVLDNGGPIEVRSIVGVRKYDPVLGKLVLDGSGVGAWKAQVGKYGRNAQGAIAFIPLSLEQDTTNGEAVFQLPPEMPLVSFVIKATPVVPIAGIQTDISLQTNETKVRVTKGSAIEGYISAKSRVYTYQGQTLGTSWLLAAIPSKDAARALGTVQWFRSQDGGTIWAEITDKAGIRFISETVTQDTSYKVRYVNKFTGLTSESSPWSITVSGAAPASVASAPAAAAVSQPVSTVPAWSGPTRAIVLKATASNATLRVPVTVALSSQTNTATANYEWNLDGVMQTDAGPTARITVTDPGNHVVTVRSGLKGDYLGEYVIAATPNLPPACTLTERMGTSSAAVTAVCADPDGKIVRATWTVNGRLVSNTLPTVNVARPAGGGTTVVTLSVMDDSGAETTTIHNVVFQ